jgi:hypothetical protein
MHFFNISYSIFVSAASVLPVFYVEKTNGSYFACCGNNAAVYSCNITLAGDITAFETNIKPNATSVVTEEDAMASASLSELFITERFDIQDTVIYVGSAAAGTADNAIGWTIKKTAISGGAPLSTMVTIKDSAIWDDRATETYY